MKNILLIISAYANSYQINRFKEEAIKLGLTPQILLPSSLYFKITNKDIQIEVSPTARDHILNLYNYKNPTQLHIWTEEQIPSNVKAIIFRAVERHPLKETWQLTPFLVHYFDQRKIPILNKERLKKAQKTNKIEQLRIFWENKIPFVPTYLINSEYGFEDFFQNNPGEYFVKPYNASHGNGALIARKASDIPYQQKILNYLMLQQRLKAKWDLRVLIVNGKAIGAIERHAPEKSIITNVSAGGYTKKHKLTKEEKELAEKVAFLLNSDYGGVDIMYGPNNTPYVLEFNLNAEFKGFEKTTGINVAKTVIQSLLSQNIQNI